MDPNPRKGSGVTGVLWAMVAAQVLWVGVMVTQWLETGHSDLLPVWVLVWIAMGLLLVFARIVGPPSRRP